MNLFIAIIIATSGTLSSTVDITFEVFTEPGSCMLYKDARVRKLEAKGYKIQKASCINRVSK